MVLYGTQGDGEMIPHYDMDDTREDLSSVMGISVLVLTETSIHGDIIEIGWVRGRV
jgi:hypothetical protein